jgi:hypothetical protein
MRPAAPGMPHPYPQPQQPQVVDAALAQRWAELAELLEAAKQTLPGTFREDGPPLGLDFDEPGEYIDAQGARPLPHGVPARAERCWRRAPASGGRGAGGSPGSPAASLPRTPRPCSRVHLRACVRACVRVPACAGPPAASQPARRLPTPRPGAGLKRKRVVMRDYVGEADEAGNVGFTKRQMVAGAPGGYPGAAYGAYRASAGAVPPRHPCPPAPLAAAARCWC